MAFPRLEQCELCGQDKKLHRSHIVPAFAYRYIMPSAGRFYNALSPKRMQQGGDRVHLLCQSCESLLSLHERDFQTLLFPAGSIASLPFNYGESLHIFCCSLSWRVLTYLKLSEPNKYIEQTNIAKLLHTQIPQEQHQLCDQARERWANTVLTRTASKVDHHIVFLNGKNVEFERSDVIGFCIFQDEENLAVATILGPMILLGFIQQGPGWVKTSVDIQPSSFSVGVQSVPPTLGRWLSDLYSSLEQVAH